MRIDLSYQCDQDWDDFSGDGNKRLCGECQHEVHDLSAMTRREAERFVERTQGASCVSFIKTADDEIVYRPEHARPRGVRGIAGMAALTVPLLLAACDTNEAQPTAVATQPVEAPEPIEEPGAAARTTTETPTEEPECDSAKVEETENADDEPVQRVRLAGKPMMRPDPNPDRPSPIKHVD